jgi:hypothetical protein
MVPDRKPSHDVACDCDCWHCTAGPALDRAIVTGCHVAIDGTDQLVVPDVIALELSANGLDVTDYAGYRVTHRGGGRTCWILSPGAAL